MGKTPVLYQDKKDCCGCEACRSVCSKGAISMVEDEQGFFYPHIDEQLCVGCGLCEGVCPIKDAAKK